ncbi:MAG: putative Ig domain-containing protein, partial [Synergistaceae bacterium]|nr:putative Ig domain-containing protein [Synergistaceae bacterium]
ITITTSTLPSAASGTYYTVTLAANVPGVSWRVSSGALPEGLSLNSSTGVISGVPTTEGTATFTVTASMPGYTGAEKQLSLTVSQTPTITITTTELPSGIFGTAYSAALTSSTSGAAWSVSSGNLPDGLTLSTSGTISGTPTRTGTFTFTVRAVYDSAAAEKQFTVTISVKRPEIMTSGLPDGTTGTAYTATLEAETGSYNWPIRWSISSGTLPPGLTLNSSTGTITGTPTTADTYTFTVRVVYGWFSAEKVLSITVNQGTIGLDNDGSHGGCSSFTATFDATILAFFLRKR